MTEERVEMRVLDEEEGSSSSVTDETERNHPTSTEDPVVGTSQRGITYRKKLTDSIVGDKDKQSPIGAYSEREFSFVKIAGLLLSFNSGYVNGACLSGLLVPSGARQSVAGFTGAYTGSALLIADGHTDRFGFQVSMILSFIFGSFLAGAMTPFPTKYRMAPSYGPTFLVGGVFLTAASILAAIQEEHEYYFFLAAAANGVQNGISSLYTGNLIRSTHLTGTSTDIGLFIGQLARGNKANLWKLQLLISLAVSFWLGGFISFYATTEFKSYSLLFNAGLYLLTGVALIHFLVTNLGISFTQAVLGDWCWSSFIDKIGGKDLDEANILHVFERFDQDGSGYIDEEELSAALADVGLPNLTTTQVQSMLKMADVNGDGQLSRDEWLEMFSKIR